MASDFEKKYNGRLPSPHLLHNEKDRDYGPIGPSISLTHADIAQAMLKSPDEGNTLNFSHKNLCEVGEIGAEELATIGIDDIKDECTVLRLALGYNRLTALPMAFALLTRLRYLNLRANSFTVFPDVITVMPSLEILDISRNKLKRLPAQPGTLLKLRVFSLSKNRITRLPPYFAKMSNLTVLQVDHNPIEWPPKHILEPLEHPEDTEAATAYIEDVKTWMSDYLQQTPDEALRKTRYNDHADQDLIRCVTHDIMYTCSDDLDKYIDRSDACIPSPQHSRSLSMESDVSSYSITSQESSSSDTSFGRDGYHEILKIHEMLATVPNSSTPSNIPSPSTGVSPFTSDTAGPFPDASSQSKEDDDLHSIIYGRNASYSVVNHPTPSPIRLASKKSLPDLRNTIDTLASDRPTLPPLATSTILHSRVGGALHGDGQAYLTATDNLTMSPLVPTHSRTSQSQPVHGQSRSVIGTDAVHSSNIESLPGPAPPMDVERNSYFRRLSTLPPSSVLSSIPKSLLVMIDSARGILFAVSQIYQSLRHYTVFAIDERLSGLLRKVLETASIYMTHLINALDRFDSVSRRVVPSPSTCRGILESCRDNVAVFGKVIGVLHLQLKVLAGADDARYSRSLLLMLYGSMAEISNSWQAMVPYLETIRPHLSEHRAPPTTISSKIQTLNTTPLTPLTGRIAGAGFVPSRRETAPSPNPRTPGQANGPNGRSRMMRRHAGSFSTRDVEIGKTLPTSEESVHSPVSLPTAGQPLRSALRKPLNSSQSALQPHSQSTSLDVPSETIYSPRGDSSLATASGIPSPYPFLSAHGQELPVPRAAHSSLEVPSDSSKMVDEDLLDTMEAATETAHSVWQMMDEVFHNGQDTDTDLATPLQLAQNITKRLKEKIRGMRGGSVDNDRKAFWEDAHIFVKAVVGVLTVLKTYSASHPFSSTLRSNIAKLTQSTQDFAILLQVSSFSPAHTPVPYSPAVGGLVSTPSKMIPGGVSRSRSALPPTSSILKPKSGEPKDGPWSALPHHQSFKVPEPS
ncbi:RAM signaling pathway protein-domain-containing protein [Hysterangium stoloniferum]|nr:RAM signaling pathway protein-domain-containing protein [Hysterangium stoloniferum]